MGLEWMNKTSYAQIPEWDLATCLAFLSTSETSQKKLPGTPTSPSRPCAVKELVGKRIRQLASLGITQAPDSSSTSQNSSFAIQDSHSLNQNSNSSMQSSSSLNQNSPEMLLLLLHTIQLQFRTLCHLHPSYNSITFEIGAPLNVNALNATLQQHLRDLIGQLGSSSPQNNLQSPALLSSYCPSLPAQASTSL